MNKKPDGGVAVSEIGHGFQFGNRSYDFRRFIVLWLRMAGNKIIKNH
jgi:hypothetical protein